MSQLVVCALYKFTALENFESLREPLRQCMEQHDVKGTILLAHEGLNGTIAGSRYGVDEVLTWLRRQPGLSEIDSKESVSQRAPFKRTKVKLKKEIVTMGVEGIDPNHTVGTYVEPENWNALLDDPDVVLIDTRNSYEVKVGTFENAVNPNTETFREFPTYAQQNLDPEKHKKVAMFCTGGIRCEKSTAYLKQLGFDNVYHLKGGILKYLERIPEKQSKWRGECFVFDDRVTVDHDLEPGSYDQCHACRLPISQQDMQSPYYQKGVSCPHCYDKVSAQDRARFAERQRQVELAKERGESHIGTTPQKNNS